MEGAVAATVVGRMGSSRKMLRASSWGASTSWKEKPKLRDASAGLDTAILLYRLQLEKGLWSGVVRLLGFLVVMVTILNAYMLATPNNDLFSLQSFFENSLDLPELLNAANLQEVRQQLVRISGAAKPLMLLSTSNLVDSTAGDLELISEATNFPQEQVLELPPETRCRVDGPEWTLSAWVKGSGNLVKKVLDAGALTCWAWEVDNVMRLRFGGHDSERVEVLEGGTSGEQLQHLTVVVSQQRFVKFFRNGTLESSLPMPRDVTDCDGQLVVADSLVTIASLKFHARALKDREVQDMFLAGRPLVEMATGKSPVVVPSVFSVAATETAENPELDLVLQQNSLQQDAYEASVDPAAWGGQHAPLIEGPVQVQQKVDLMFNLSYFSLVEEPVRIESSVPVDLATLPELPADESFTYTFWSRMTSDGAPFGWFRKSFSDRGSAVIANSIEFRRPYMGTSYDPDGDATTAYTGFQPEAAGVILGGPKWRMFVFVYDVTTQSMRGYLDGVLIQDTKPGVIPEVARVNTYPDPLPRENAVFPREPEETAELGLFYRGVIAHMRIYRGVVWTEPMIQQYHLEAETLGVPLLECKRPSELADDLLWSDSFGTLDS